MSFPAELLALGVLFLFGTIFYLMIRASRRERNELTNQLSQLGFEPLEYAPPELEQRVKEINQTDKDQEIKLWQIYHRREFDRDLYLFNVADTRGEGSELGSGVFGIISNRLALPRFSLVTLPDFDQAGLIGSLMDKILEKVMSYAERRLQLQRIEFPDRPELDDQMILFGRNPSAVREMLDRIGQQILRSSQLPVQIAGSGDFLTVDFSTTSSLDQQGEDLVSRYQTFIQISRAFME
jgi:hypothetical protein